MTTQVDLLKVDADTSGLEAGAKRIDTATKQAAASAKNLTDATDRLGDSSAKLAPKISQAGDAAERLRRAFVPGAADAAKLQTVYESLNTQLSLGTLKAEEYAVALDGAIRRHGTDASSAILAARGQAELSTAIQRTTLQYREQSQAIVAANQNMIASHGQLSEAGAQFRKQNLGQQLLDVGQTAALGAPLGMIALQQGPQIAGIYAGQGGVKALLGDLLEIGKVLAPVGIGLAILYGGFKVLAANSTEARMSIDETTKALAAQAAPISSLEGKIEELAKIQKDYRDAILSTADSQDSATKSIIANSEREYNAKKDLLELELKRQEAAQKVLESQIAIEGLHLRQDIGTQVNQPAQSPVAGGFADPKINGGIPFVHLPDDISGMQKLNEIIANSPITDKLREMHDNLTLDQIATEKLREGLGLTFNTVPPQSAIDRWREYGKNIEGLNDALHAIYNPPNVDISRVPIPTARPENGAGYPPIDYQSDSDKSQAKTESAYDAQKRAADASIKSLQQQIAYSGLAADARARLLAEDQAEAQYREAIARNSGKFNQTELDTLKQKADAQSRLNQQLAGVKFDQGQQDQLGALRQQADVIGLSAEAQARSNAVYQANLAMKQQGISLLGQEADARRANAEALASYDQAIQRSQAAAQGLQQTEGSVIDDLLTGTGKMSDRLKAAAADVLKYIAQLGSNDVKNALTGTNLPGLSDLFSGKPATPTLTPTNASVMTVTASVVNINGGLPGFPTGPGGVLPTTPGSLSSVLGINNAVRPTLTNTGIVNPPITSAAAPSGDVAAYIRSYSSQIGIDPAVALRVARSEGGLTSWNRQSDVINAQGVREQSYGPFQLYKNGGLGSDFQRQTGLDPALAENGPAATRFALDNAKQNGWTAFHGAANTGISKWQGIGKNPGIDPQTTNSVTQSLQKLSTTTAETTNNFTGLGDSTKTLQSSFADFLGGTKLPGSPSGFPAAPGAPMGPNFFPPAPAAPFNPLMFLKSIPILGNIFSLFGFADGTDFSPGGPARVNERGGEVINLPRGSQVIPAHKVDGYLAGGRGGGNVKVDVGVSVDDTGNLKAYVRSVSHSAVDERAPEHAAAAVGAYRQNGFAEDMNNYRAHPYQRG